MDEAMTAKEPKKEGGMEEWEIKEACDTLIKAEMIKADADKMKVLQPYLNEKAKAAQSLADHSPDPKEGVDGLKKLAKKKLSSY